MNQRKIVAGFPDCFPSSPYAGERGNCVFPSYIQLHFTCCAKVIHKGRTDYLTSRLGKSIIQSCQKLLFLSMCFLAGDSPFAATKQKLSFSALPQGMFLSVWITMETAGPLLQVSVMITRRNSLQKQFTATLQ